MKVQDIMQQLENLMDVNLIDSHIMEMMKNENPKYPNISEIEMTPTLKIDLTKEQIEILNEEGTISLSCKFNGSYSYSDEAENTYPNNWFGFEVSNLELGIKENQLEIINYATCNRRIWFKK